METVGSTAVVPSPLPSLSFTLSDQERVAIFLVMSDTPWGGGEQHILSQLEIVDTLALEEFDSLKSADAKTMSGEQKPYTLTNGGAQVLRLVLAGFGQRYAFGRYSARAMKRIFGGG